jgi:DNA-binding transcriptional LysR family regulator
MADTVRSSLTALETTLFAPRAFDPKTLERTFRVRPSDYVEALLVAPLLRRLAKAAPRVDFWSRPSTTEPTLALEEGQLDLLIQPTRTGEPTGRFRSQVLWHDQFVGIARRGHPLMKGRLTLERLAAASHVLITPTGQPGGMVDDVLEQHRLQRRIAFATPNFVVAPQVVATTDLVMIVPARLATTLAFGARLVTFEPPLKVPSFQIAMFWHDRHDSDPAHAFIRQEIAQVAAALPKRAARGR